MSSMNIKFPLLETDRLILKELNYKDLNTLFQYWSDDEVTKYMNIDSFTSTKQVEDMVNLLNDLFQNKQAIRWGIFEKKNNQLIGTCGYNTGFNKEACIGEIGYDLGKMYWGHGYMQEALRSIINYGFIELNLNRIEGYVILGNAKSENTLDKLGFKKEGILREHGCYKDNYWDECIYSLLKREWVYKKTDIKNC